MAWTLIRGGTVVDGTGSPPFQADVCIRDGVIDAVGPDLSAPEGAQVLDAAGKLITPGFINLHSHYHGICRTLRPGGRPSTA